MAINFPEGTQAFPARCLNYNAATKTNTQYHSSTTWTDVSGLSVTITPRSTASVFLVSGHVNVGADGDSCCNFRLLRNGTTIANANSAGNRTTAHTTTSYSPTGGYNMEGVGIGHLDSPGTTSAVTYKIQCNQSDTSGTGMFINYISNTTDDVWVSRATSHIAILELQ